MTTCCLRCCVIVENKKNDNITSIVGSPEKVMFCLLTYFQRTTQPKQDPEEHRFMMDHYICLPYTCGDNHEMEVLLIRGSELAVRFNQYLKGKECLLVPKGKVVGIIKGEHLKVVDQRERH